MKLTPEQQAERIALKDALLEHSDYEREFMTDLLWGRIERAAKDAHQHGFTPEDIAIGAEAFRHQYRDADCTPQAILGALAMVPKWAASGPRRKRR